MFSFCTECIDRMISSNEESLAGFTQVPCQKRDSDRNFKLHDPNDLIDCSGNKQSDYDDFTGQFLDETGDFENSSKSGSEAHDNSVELFPTPPEQNDGAVASVHLSHATSSNATSSAVSIYLLTFFCILL